ncbi:uncharacterized protein LOC130051700 isoform X2 [Ostrea edulis]|uniref:uncharacterized protein LOC130051700 isoform X2 n=1 Tax=Ostrea edulis TaxID=37623 RepID=UPI0024AE9A77|nr:uncharacterized protein LOC130051700 isoform X2 [Ostrea edulis]
MASSGIAEHNEARRKAGRAELLAFRKKQLLEKFTDSDNLNGLINGGGTYEEEISRKSGINGTTSPNCAANVDRQRRELIRQQQLVEYSAKLPKRFSSTDYVSQW